MGTALISFLLAGLLILLVLISLAALVYAMTMLLNGSRSRDEVATNTHKQQRFLTASILHMIARR